MTTTIDQSANAPYCDPKFMAKLATRLIKVDSRNLVERPWGGDGMRAYKQLPANISPGDWPWGEAFEISAYDEDREAAAFPSRVVLDDGTSVELPVLLRECSDALLGEAFVSRYGACFPLLPKTLSVRELLSVQGHPEGNTEVYIIIAAEAGSTLRLGFQHDVNAAEMTAVLERGLEQQADLLSAFEPTFDAIELQRIAQPWFAAGDEADASLRAWLDEQLEPVAAERAVGQLNELKALYWQVLNSMNAIEVKPGQVLYNATPDRVLAGSGRAPSAEVHALGNPEGREILALEIRMPGPTFRAWDNVRFPQREVDVRAAIASLNLGATTAQDFVCEPVPIPGRAGASVSVASRYFTVEHLRPDAGMVVPVPVSSPHSLHCLEGEVICLDAAGNSIGTLKQGESALVPFAVGAYRVQSSTTAHVVRALLPEAE